MPEKGQKLKPGSLKGAKKPSALAAAISRAKYSKKGFKKLSSKAEKNK